MNQSMATPRAARSTDVKHDGVFLSIAYGWSIVAAANARRLVRDIDTGMLVMTAQPFAECGA